MNINVSTIFFLYCEQFATVVAQGIPINPCPKIFQYRFNGSEWFGLIAVQISVQQALQVTVTLSISGKPSTNYLGEIELLTRGQLSGNVPVYYQVHFPKLHFPPKLVHISVNNKVICFGSVDHNIFMTQIQLEHTRKLTFISDKKYPIFMTESTHTESGLTDNKEKIPVKPELTSETQSHIQLKKKAFSSLNKKCGTIHKSVRLRMIQRKERTFQSSNFKSEKKLFDDIRSPVFDSHTEYDAGIDETLSVFSNDGNNWPISKTYSILPLITRGAWPWLAAIYVNNLTSLNFQCGGTLLSARVVISSAHCFQLLNDRYTANEVLVFLGRHNLRNWNEEGSLAASVNDIYIHSDFKKQLSNYDADIAIVLLKDQVRFNAFIQPVCLWSGSSKTDYIVGEQGIVIGWSFDKKGLETFLNTLTTAPASINNKKSDAGKILPLVIQAPIVSNEVCFKANNKFRSLSSNRTFCGGVPDSKVSKEFYKFPNAQIYTGISGTGLLIFKNNLWMLRGTVSATLPTITKDLHCDNTRLCSNTQYIIYSDVAKYLDWIMAFII